MPDTAIGSALTEGTGISSLTVPKIIKDLIADILLSGAAALATANIMDLGSAIAAPQVAAFAIAGAVIHSAYRFILKWATT